MTRTGALLNACGVLALLLLPAASAGPPPAGVPADSVQWLLGEVDRLTDEVSSLRRQLAASRIEADTARKKATELEQFIEDRHEYADDFAQYRAVKEAAQRDARQRQLAAARERHEQALAARRARAEEIRAERARADAEQQRLDRYADAGFADLGLDVFGGRMSFSYALRNQSSAWVDYDPIVGLYYRPGGPSTRVDYGRMTISGSILNASKTVRNVGIAVTFFDDHGNQVGAETVQINNARPDVPYPFTSTLEMALDRPFTSSSTYVLYADPAE
jgi:hypothetical protein